MANIPESKIEKHLKTQVEKSGGKVRKLKWIGKAGAPDRLMWWPMSKLDPRNPRAAFVELKAPGKKPTRIQLEEHANLREDGWCVLVVDSIESADAAIAAVRDGAAPRAPAAQLKPAKSAAEIDIVKTPQLPVSDDNSDLV